MEKRNVTSMKLLTVLLVGLLFVAPSTMADTDSSGYANVSTSTSDDTILADNSLDDEVVIEDDSDVEVAAPSAVPLPTGSDEDSSSDDFSGMDE